MAGSGVIGLSVARVLQERGYEVVVYAKSFPPLTTSNVAGAMWWPVATECGEDVESRARFDRAVLISWRRFASLSGDARYGVDRLPGYIAGEMPHMLFDLPEEVLREACPSELPRGSFGGGRVRRFETWRIETPRYLEALCGDVIAGGGRLVERVFAGLSDLSSLPGSAVVNCLGLGASSVVGDESLFGVRGQLVKLRSQPGVGFIAQFGDSYLIPRGDGLVLGGTWDEVKAGEALTAEPPRAGYEGILASHRAFFGGLSSS